MTELKSDFFPLDELTKSSKIEFKTHYVKIF